MSARSNQPEATYQVTRRTDAGMKRPTTTVLYRTKHRVERVGRTRASACRPSGDDAIILT